jgi:hypothetical protein
VIEIKILKSAIDPVQMKEMSIEAVTEPTGNVNQPSTVPNLEQTIDG